MERLLGSLFCSERTQLSGCQDYVTASALFCFQSWKARDQPSVPGLPSYGLNLLLFLSSPQLPLSVGAGSPPLQGASGEAVKHPGPLIEWYGNASWRSVEGWIDLPKVYVLNLEPPIPRRSPHLDIKVWLWAGEMPLWTQGPVPTPTSGPSQLPIAPAPKYLPLFWTPRKPHIHISTHIYMYI